MVTLNDYMRKSKMTVAEFADAIGVSTMTVYRYLSGERRPSWEILPKIVAATGGKVTADSFLDHRKSRVRAA